MNRRGFLAGLLAAVAVVAGISADARMHSPYRGHRIIPANAAPLDGVTAPQLAYGFRQLRSAYAGASMQIRRASDNAVLDINFLGFVPGLGAPWDVAAAASHCASTTCFVSRWYNQGTAGTTHDLLQATTANQPALIFNCNGTLPCLRMTVNTQTLASANNMTPASGIVSFGLVANRTLGTAFCGLISQNSGAAANSMTTKNVTGTWTLTGGTSGSLDNATATEVIWHSVQGVINGAGSSHTVDGSSTLLSVTGNTLAGLPRLVGGGASGTTCNWAEAIAWDAYVLTTSDKAVIRANQQAYFSTP
jgi:hypothetical protein